MRSKLGPGVGLLLVSLFLLLSGGREAIAQSAGLTTFVNVDRGCGATYRIGNPIRINFGANKTARLRLVLQKDEFTPVTLFDADVSAGDTVVFNSTIGSSLGTRTLRLLLTRSDTNSVSDNCGYDVITALSPGP